MRDRIIEKLLLLAALSAIGVLALITIFIFQKGLPVLIDRGPWEFLSSKTWSPDQAPVHFGLLTFLVGSAMVTAGALVIGVPLALACAIVL
jgi:phosphate transport system permease protein